MKALSIQQPWAWLIICGADGRFKDVENRTWSTDFYGRIYVHTGMKFDDEGYRYVTKNMGISLPAPSSFAHGGIIGTVELIDCVTEYDSPWFVGPYGFVLREPQAMKFVPYKGRLKFFNVEL